MGEDWQVRRRVQHLNWQQLWKASERYAEGEPAIPRQAAPSWHLAIVTCMDARIDPIAVFGLHLGQAHVMRNAGGRVSDDVIRSLAVSQGALGTRAVLVMMHTQCGMLGLDPASVTAPRPGSEPMDFLPLVSLEEDLRADLAKIRDSAWIYPDTAIAGCIFDVDTGRVMPIATRT